MDQDDVINEDVIIEDGVTFVMRAGSATHRIGIDVGRPQVLEVSQLWGDTLLDARHFSQVEPEDVTVGSGVGHRWQFLGVDMGFVPAPLHRVLPYVAPMWSEVHEQARDSFFADDDAMPEGLSHVLFRFDDGRYVGQVPVGWDGFLDRGDDRFSLEEAVQQGLATLEHGIYQVPMVRGVRLAVEVQGVSWFAHLVAAGSKLAHPRAEPVDLPLVGIGSMLMGLGGLFAVAMWMLPAPPHITVTELTDGWQTVQLETPKPPEPPKPSIQPEGSEGPRRAEPNGTPGKRDAVDKIASGGAQVETLRHDTQIASEAGLLGALNELGAAPGLADAALDRGLVAGVGGLVGRQGSQIGYGGLDGHGVNGGGGGEIGTLGGGLGSKGIGSGRHGYGVDGGGIGPKGTGGLRIAGDPLVLGSLDRAQIDAVVKRNTASIKYCYQRQLPQHPDLAGKISVKFVIAGDGTVSSASLKESSLGNASVESCVVGRFKTMRFPEPKGNGMVIVTYPFLFSPG